MKKTIGIMRDLILIIIFSLAIMDKIMGNHELFVIEMVGVFIMIYVDLSLRNKK